MYTYVQFNIIKKVRVCCIIYLELLLLLGVPIGWHFLFQFLNTRSKYILNTVVDKLQPCLNSLVSLKPFVIRLPIFIFQLDPFYNDFIASINLLLIVDLSRISHNLFNGTLSYVFVKSIFFNFPIFIFQLDPLYNDFIASINLLLIVDLSRVSHNLFNGTLSYVFVKSINNRCNSLLVIFFFSIICVMQKILYIHDLPARKPDCSSISIFLYSNSTNMATMRP